MTRSIETDSPSYAPTAAEDAAIATMESVSRNADGNTRKMTIDKKTWSQKLRRLIKLVTLHGVK